MHPRPDCLKLHVVRITLELPVCVGGGMLPLRFWDNWPYRFYLSGKWSMKRLKWSLGAPLGNKSEIKFNHFCIKLTENAPRNTHSSSWTWNSSSGDCECQEGDVFVPPMGWWCCGLEEWIEKINEQYANFLTHLHIISSVGPLFSRTRSSGRHSFGSGGPPHSKHIREIKRHGLGPRYSTDPVSLIKLYFSGRKKSLSKWRLN